MEVVIQELQTRWGDKGWNEQERNAYGADYVKKFPNYPSLKKKLLELTDNTQNKDEKRYYNALRIYTYTIFENLWFGYLMSYEDSEMKFKLKEGSLLDFTNPFSMYLPYFSAAILHFGSCRDFLFVLLQLCIKKQIRDKDELKKIIFFRYNENTFKNDLKILSKENENSKFIKKGEEVFNLNEFRNYFAHRMRLLWWKPIDNQEKTFFIKKSVCDIFKDSERDRIIKATTHVFDVLTDPEKYQHEIENADYNDLIGVNKILQNTHDSIASFYSDFLMIMEKSIK